LKRGISAPSQILLSEQAVHISDLFLYDPEKRKFELVEKDVKVYQHERFDGTTYPA
jgi:hypothetical protein